MCLSHPDNGRRDGLSELPADPTAAATTVLLAAHRTGRVSHLHCGFVSIRVVACRFTPQQVGQAARLGCLQAGATPGPAWSAAVHLERREALRDWHHLDRVDVDVRGL